MVIIKRGLYSIINEKYLADIDDEDSSSMVTDKSVFLGRDDTQRTQHTVTVICITEQKCNIGKSFDDIKAKMRETIERFTENVGSTRYYCNFVGCNEKLKEKYEYKNKYSFESKNEYIGKVRDLQKIYPLPNNQFGIAVGIDCNLLFDTYEKVLEFIYSLSDTSFDTKGLFDKGFIVFEPYVGDSADETHDLDDTVKIPFNIQELRYDYKMHYATSLLKFLGLDDNITDVAQKLYGNNGIDEWLTYGKFSEYKLSQPIILKVENEMNIQNGDIKSLRENIYAHWQILELPNAHGDVAYSPSKGQFGTQPLNHKVAQYIDILQTTTGATARYTCDKSSKFALITFSLDGFVMSDGNNTVFCWLYLFVESTFTRNEKSDICNFLNNIGVDAADIRMIFGDIGMKEKDVDKMMSVNCCL